MLYNTKLKITILLLIFSSSTFDAPSQVTDDAGIVHTLTPNGRYNDLIDIRADKNLNKRSFAAENRVNGDFEIIGATVTGVKSSNGIDYNANPRNSIEVTGYPESDGDIPNADNSSFATFDFSDKGEYVQKISAVIR